MRIGAYELQDEIGRGGMGVVHRARGPDGRLVALKLLLGASPEARARFERERRLLAEFTARDGFVPLLDAGSSPSGPWIVMPLIEGGSLRDRLARGPLPVAEVEALGTALATALGQAHARGIVHRDMKPENVLFASEGRPLVADLGLARHFDRSAPGASRSADISRSGAILGTAGYGAPEQIGGGGEVTPASDVFSLGAVLYECLTGRPPFRGATVLETLSRVGDGRFEPVRERRADAPRWLAATVERSLARDPRARFGDGLAFARALREPKRRRAPVAVLLAFFVLAAAALGAILHARRDAPRIERAPPPASPSPPTSTELVARAEAALHENRFLDAVALATSALALDPRDRRAHEVQFIAEFEVFQGPDEHYTSLEPGPLKRAIEALGDRRPVEEPGLEPWLAAYICARTLLTMGGDSAPTLRQIEKFATLAPWNASAPLLRAFLWSTEGAAHRDKGDLSGAVERFRAGIREFDEAARRCPDFLTSDAVRYGRGRLHAGLGETAAAIADFDAIPTSSAVHGFGSLVKAQTLGEAGDADAWRAYGAAATEFAPTGKTRLYLIICYREGVNTALAQGRRNEAIELLGQTMRLGLGMAMGVCLEAMDEVRGRDQVAAQARLGVERTPTDRTLLAILATAEESQGHKDAAREAYERLAATYPAGETPEVVTARIAAVR